jgi:hypothetical protein
MTKVTVISLELAAQCWCDEDTSNIEMDSHLANAFAKRLDTKDKRIAELERERNARETSIRYLSCSQDWVDFTTRANSICYSDCLDAHNLEVRKQAFTDAVRYMEHSDKLITTHDVEIFIAEVDVYLSDKAGES